MLCFAFSRECARFFINNREDRVTVGAGVLEDGIPALRVYLKHGDRAGVSIPTTANSKAIIKQVKRALQVMSNETCA